MRRAVNKNFDDDLPQFTPATTIEAREQQLAHLALVVSEKRMRDGTASSQEITYWMKQGGTRETLERRKLLAEIAEKDAKIESMENAADVKDLLEQALSAFTDYRGEEPTPTMEDFVD